MTTVDGAPFGSRAGSVLATQRSHPRGDARDHLTALPRGSVHETGRSDIPERQRRAFSGANIAHSPRPGLAPFLLGWRVAFVAVRTAAGEPGRWRNGDRHDETCCRRNVDGRVRGSPLARGACDPQPHKLSAVSSLGNRSGSTSGTSPCGVRTRVTDGDVLLANLSSLAFDMSDFNFATFGGEWTVRHQRLSRRQPRRRLLSANRSERVLRTSRTRTTPKSSRS